MTDIPLVIRHETAADAEQGLLVAHAEVGVGVLR